jgi:ABC-type branched-chain amino acid transport systems, periplasmic component
VAVLRDAQERHKRKIAAGAAVLPLCGCQLDKLIVGTKGGIMSAVQIILRRAGELLGIGVVTFGLLLSGSADADDIKLGILFDVTGPVANFVPPLLDAVKLAVDEVNANGGILGGQKLQMIVGDTKGTAQGSIDAATKLVNVDNVAAIVGALTSSPR